jgi:hypothetical protein
MSSQSRREGPATPQYIKAVKNRAKYARPDLVTWPCPGRDFGKHICDLSAHQYFWVLRHWNDEPGKNNFGVITAVWKMIEDDGIILPPDLRYWEE